MISERLEVSSFKGLGIRDCAWESYSLDRTRSEKRGGSDAGWTKRGVRIGRIQGAEKNVEELL